MKALFTHGEVIIIFNSKPEIKTWCLTLVPAELNTLFSTQVHKSEWSGIRRNWSAPKYPGTLNKKHFTFYSQPSAEKNGLMSAKTNNNLTCLISYSFSDYLSHCVFDVNRIINYLFVFSFYAVAPPSDELYLLYFGYNIIYLL